MDTSSVSRSAWRFAPMGKLCYTFQIMRYIALVDGKAGADAVQNGGHLTVERFKRQITRALMRWYTRKSRD